MSRKNKLFDRLKNNPKDVRFGDIRNLMVDIGFELKRTSGSHYIFSKGDITFVIPAHNNKVKAVYVKRLIDIIEKQQKG